MVKATTDELNKLRSLKTASQDAAEIVGRLSVELELLKRELQRAGDILDSSVKEQEAYLKELHGKYGDGSLDIETGEITS